MLIKRVIQITVALLAVGICIAVIAAYQYLMQSKRGRDYPVGPGDFNDTGAYLIKPSTTLIDLSNDVNDILTPVSYEESFQSSGNDSQVKWSFSDYLKV